jgi:DNA sulfur modification protein DndE
VKKSNVEMTWKTFTGASELMYTALLRHIRFRSPEDIALKISEAELAAMHIERGLARLMPQTKKKGISSLLELTQA